MVDHVYQSGQFSDMNCFFSLLQTKIDQYIDLVRNQVNSTMAKLVYIVCHYPHLWPLSHQYPISVCPEMGY